MTKPHSILNTAMTAAGLLIAVASFVVAYDTWDRTFFAAPKTESRRPPADNHKSSRSEVRMVAPGATDIPTAWRGYEMQSDSIPPECYRVATERLGYFYLPLQSRPSAYSRILLEIPPYATGLRAIGRISYSSDGVLWREVAYKRKVGWVYDYYIERM
jgi:hypothetical protein